MIEANIALGTPMVYSSSTTTQTTGPVVPNATNQVVIGIQVNTLGNLIPLLATQFNLNTNGSTNPATDITNAKLYYTGVSSTFSTANQFGATVASPSGPFVINGSQALIQGTNYFWLTYDIPAGAVVGNVVDAECQSITLTGTPVTPTVTAPAGDRLIKNALAAGDYTVGLTMFNRVSGRSVYAVKETRKVLRSIVIPFDRVSRDQQNRGYESPDFAPGITRTVEMDEDYYILMENGKPLTGRVFAPVTDKARRDLGIGDNVLAIYPTITAALFDLNNLGVLGPVRFLFVDATYPTETYPLTVNVVAPGVPTATNTVTFKPAAGISPTISGSYAGPVFRVIGTNYVTIDGSNTNGGTTRDLTITNVGTASTNVLQAGSVGTTPVDHFVVKNCNLINGTHRPAWSCPLRRSVQPGISQTSLLRTTASRSPISASTQMAARWVAATWSIAAMPLTQSAPMRFATSASIFREPMALILSETTLATLSM
jgi:hypothetical protein